MSTSIARTSFCERHHWKAISTALFILNSFLCRQQLTFEHALDFFHSLQLAKASLQIMPQIFNNDNAFYNNVTCLRN